MHPDSFLSSALSELFVKWVQASCKVEYVFYSQSFIRILALWNVVWY